MGKLEKCIEWKGKLVVTDSSDTTPTVKIWPSTCNDKENATVWSNYWNKIFLEWFLYDMVKELLMIIWMILMMMVLKKNRSVIYGWLSARVRPRKHNVWRTLCLPPAFPIFWFSDFWREPSDDVWTSRDGWWGRCDATSTSKHLSFFCTPTCCFRSINKLGDNFSSYSLLIWLDFLHHQCFYK